MDSFISVLWVLFKVTLIIGIIYFIFKILLWLFFKYAKVYYTSESGERSLVGYLWQTFSNQYILYDGIPFLGANRIGYIKSADNSIYLRTMNAQHNYVEIMYGRFSDDGSVYDATSLVAVCDTSEVRKSFAFAANKQELAYATGSYRAKADLMTRAAAVGALWQSAEDSETERPDVRIGFVDLALPSALIFMLLYIPFSLAAHSFVLFPFLGMEVSYTLNMLLFYFFIAWILYGVKHEMTLRNRSLAFILGLIDRNVGVGTINILIIVLSVIGVLSCTFITSYTMLPLFLVLSFAFLLNLKCFNGLWKLADPCSTWGRKWKRATNSASQSAGPLPQGGVGKTLIERTFDWGPVLDLRGIAHHNEQVTIHLYEEDFKDYKVAGTVRSRNPFLNEVNSYEDLVNYTRQVLNGSDENTNKVEETALVQIINSAYQICQNYNLADFELYDLILLFCQVNIHYVIDEESAPINKKEEYFRFPSETLYDGEGDCDCKSVLAYRIFDILGVDVNFVLLKIGDSQHLNHAAVVLKKGVGSIVPLPPEFKEYKSGKGVYCELTGEGYAPGELPKGVDIDSITTINQIANV